MGLKITTQIGTNRGLTSSAYVRISNYEISKTGYVQLNLQIYQNEEDANPAPSVTPIFKECLSLEIGSFLKIPIMKELTRTVKVNQLFDEVQTVLLPKINTDGTLGDDEEREVTVKVTREVDVEQTYEVPDMSIVENQDIFTFGYTKLKEKLVSLFGNENIVDC
jgi:hypothetical protein